jgi:hypothetical protein
VHFHAVPANGHSQASFVMIAQTRPSYVSMVDNYNARNSKKVGKSFSTLNTFISKDIQTKLMHLSLVNVILIAVLIVFQNFRLGTDADGNQHEHDAVCHTFMMIRICFRSTLWFTSFVLFLPTTGLSRFRLYRRQQCRRTHRNSLYLEASSNSLHVPQEHVVRTPFLRVCEIVALAQVSFLVFAIITLAYGLSQDRWMFFLCPSRTYYEIHVSFSILFVIMMMPIDHQYGPHHHWCLLSFH